MDRDRTVGTTLAASGVALFSVLAVQGSIRHPVEAVDATGPPEYAAIATALALATTGLLLVLLSLVPD